MFIKTPPRRIKAQLNLLVILLSIFFATLILCGIFFAFFFLSSAKLISPLTKTPAVNADGIVAQVKVLCQDNHINCADIRSVDDTTIQILLDTNAIVLLSTKKDLKNQLASLQQALSQLTIKGKQFKKLDFRFDNTVISF